MRSILAVFSLGMFSSCGSVDDGVTIIDNILFCSSATEEKTCSSPDTSFDAGITTIYATYEVDIYDTSGSFTIIWNRLNSDNREIARKKVSSTQKGKGRIFARLVVNDGLPAGSYELDVSYMGSDSSGSSNQSFSVK